MTTPIQDDACGQATGTIYRIRVSGALGEEWSRRAQGMTLSVHRSEPEKTFTELAGELADEAALMGLLDALYIHGAHLLSVEHVDEGKATVVKIEDSPEPFEVEKDP